MRQPIVVIGPPVDAHATAVVNRIRERGGDAILLNTQDFPEQMRLSLTDKLQGGIFLDGHPLRPKSVYIRDLGLNPSGANWKIEGDETEMRKTLAAIRERSDIIMSTVLRWEEDGVPIYNPQRPRARITKPYQIALLSAAGLPVPESLWTNDPKAVREFAKGRRIAYKPVAGGAATKELSERDLTDERLELLSASPVCFQELLPGEDIRVYVLDGKVIASVKILTKALDFRQNEEGIEQIKLTDEMARVCLKSCEVLGLRFTGMDIKGDEKGVLKILELNSSPMFLGFDKMGGTDIYSALCNALMA